jgi:DNA-binding PadR family transcriptional regulator
MLGGMTAEQISQSGDTPDPRSILRELPRREHENFLAIYREAVDGAHDPEGWDYLRRVLRAWKARAIAVRQPGFYEAEEAARNGTGEGMLLDDYLRERRGA